MDTYGAVREGGDCPTCVCVFHWWCIGGRVCVCVCDDFWDEETPLWTSEPGWLQFMSSTRDAFNQTPLHHKPRSFFWTSSIVFLKSISLRADLDSKSPSSCVWGGKEAESSSSSKWRASVWTPTRGALAARWASCDWPSQLDAVAMGFLSCCERSSRVRDSSSRS